MDRKKHIRNWSSVMLIVYWPDPQFKASVPLTEMHMCCCELCHCPPQQLNKAQGLVPLGQRPGSVGWTMYSQLKFGIPEFEHQPSNQVTKASRV